jgi:hypothetical protein
MKELTWSTLHSLFLNLEATLSFVETKRPYLDPRDPLLAD